MIKPDTFGLLIAFLLPGFICLSGFALTWPDVAQWMLISSGKEAATVGGFLYTTLASLALGLLISAIRWATIDEFLLRRYVSPIQTLNFGALSDPEKFAAFRMIVDAHYRFYQYYANTFVALIAAFPTYYFYSLSRPPCWVWIVFIVICMFLICGARDAIIKYEKRARAILA